MDYCIIREENSLYIYIHELWLLWSCFLFVFCCFSAGVHDPSLDQVATSHQIALRPHKLDSQSTFHFFDELGREVNIQYSISIFGQRGAGTSIL